MIKFVTDADLSEETAAALREALDLDHPGGCGASCDIDAARDNGYLLAAAWLLMGATETPHVDLVLERQPWRLSLAWWKQETEWNMHHRTFGVKCPDCWSYTYGTKEALPSVCGNCGSAQPVPHWHVEYGVEHWEPLVARLDTVYVALGMFLEDRAELEYPKITALADAGDPAAGIEAFRRWEAWSKLSRLLCSIATAEGMADSHWVHMNTPDLMAEVSNPDRVPPGVKLYRCTEDECAPSPWDCETERFWGPHPCNVLFTHFEQSAFQREDRTPLVSHDTVCLHIASCQTCQDTDTRVTLDGDNLGTLEWSAPVDDES